MKRLGIIFRGCFALLIQILPVVALVLIGAGAWWIYPPAALVAVGVLLWIDLHSKDEGK